MLDVKKVSLFGLIALVAVGCHSEQDKRDIGKQKEERPPVAIVVNQPPQKVEPEMQKKKTAAPKKMISKAHCVLSAKGQNAVVGAVTFSQVEGGVRIIADVGGLSHGKHGFHIHEHGDCSSADGSSAGGHFNPTNKKHGGPDSGERHLGDLGNLEANESGFAHYDKVIKELSLNGDNSIVGKSIVVHADEDDLKTDPAGNSGKRIACGLIMASE